MDDAINSEIQEAPSTESTETQDKDASSNKGTNENVATQTQTPKFTGGVCSYLVSYGNGTPPDNKTEFIDGEEICFTGRISGISGTHSVTFIATFPDGTTMTDRFDAMNNDVIGYGWVDCGVGVGNFKVIFDATGQTLGYYEFIVYEDNIPSALEPADYARALYAEGYGREEIIQDFVNGGMSRNEAIDIVDNCGIDWGEQNLTQNTTSTDCQGHRFDVATCKIPSTCIYCGLTEGEPVECQYIHGICHFCGVEDPNSYNNE